MIVVADSGSSKTDWMVHTETGVESFSTQGINPYFLNAHDIQKILTKNKGITAIAEQVKEVYFFGAGCATPDKHEIVSNGLSSFFTKAFVSVDNDLIGSAYATCGHQEGLACILGTGSNISYYDGTNVHKGKHGLGYILGDEGSGTFFGRKVLVSYLYGTMPEDLRMSFATTYAATKDDVIHNLYQKPFPNAYLANFSRFMAMHKAHPFIQQMLKEGFQEFVDTNIKDYKTYKSIPCNFVGSIAWYYQDELREVCARNQIKVHKILQKPIEGIFDYILKREGLISA